MCVLTNDSPFDPLADCRRKTNDQAPASRIRKGDPMVRQSDGRHYRLLMEKALAARHLGHSATYQTLLTEAEILLKHIRESSSLQVEGHHAQHSLEQNRKL